MGGPLELAQEIRDATRVITDAASARPGRPVNIDVLPGFAPFAGISSVTDTVTGTITGVSGGMITLSGTAAGLVDTVKISVKYTIYKDGKASSDFVASPPLNPDPSGSDSLSIAFLLKPDFSDDTAPHVPKFDPAAPPDPGVFPIGHFQIKVTIEVKVQDMPVTKDVYIDVDLPPVLIPAICVMADHKMVATTIMRQSTFSFPPSENGVPNKLFVMVRAASALSTLNQLLSVLNELMELFDALRSLLGFAADFVATLQIIVDALNNIPTVFLSVGNAGDLSQFGGFDERASSLVLVGVQETQVTAYQQEGFQPDFITFSTNIIKPVPNPQLPMMNIQLPLGTLIVDDFHPVNFDSDVHDNINDDIASVRFGGKF